LTNTTNVNQYVCCVVTGESCFQVKIEVESNSETEYLHDDMPAIGVLLFLYIFIHLCVTFCHLVFVPKIENYYYCRMIFHCRNLYQFIFMCTESCFQMKTEADSNDITDDKLTVGMFGLFDVYSLQSCVHLLHSAVTDICFESSYSIMSECIYLFIGLCSD